MEEQVIEVAESEQGVSNETSNGLTFDSGQEHSLGNSIKAGEGLAKPVLSPLLSWILAILSGATVANLYYANPILEILKAEFDVDTQSIASVNALLQGGYCAGLIISFGLSYAPFRIFQTLCFLMGVVTVAPQVIVPLAADLSSAKSMGSNVGKILSGIQIGVLLARVLSGIIADHLSYHSVFLLAGGTQLMLGLLVMWLMPNVPRNNDGISLWEIYKSCWYLLRTETKLQQCSIIAFLCYTAFTTFWTTSTFLLASAPYFYPSTTIGLLGLAGISGTLAAPLGGKLADHFGGSFFVILVGIAIMTLSWIISVSLGKVHIAAIAVAAFCLDGGRQMQQVANQLRVYTISPTSRSRVNGVYMIIAYSGTFVGSLVGTQCWVADGWTLVCVAGFFAVGLASLTWGMWDLQGDFRIAKAFRSNTRCDGGGDEVRNTLKG
ncbi:hypothetical protein HDU93_002145 [Gonapodya sp. JEL0774]|nr:hypothetical protein HDU93_002145 [Gonapodya sp. JEL0774]